MNKSDCKKLCVISLLITFSNSRSVIVNDWIVIDSCFWALSWQWWEARTKYIPVQILFQDLRGLEQSQVHVCYNESVDWCEWQGHHFSINDLEVQSQFACFSFDEELGLSDKLQDVQCLCSFCCSMDWTIVFDIKTVSVGVELPGRL